MAYTSRQGLVGQFKTGYLQREIILHRCVVKDGTDVSRYNASVAGYIVGRIVKITKSSDAVGEYFTIEDPADVTAPLTDGTHIIAQSDNTVRDVPGDYIPAEKYNTVYDGIVANTGVGDLKAVAVYKIVNKDDINLVTL